MKNRQKKLVIILIILSMDLLFYIVFGNIMVEGFFKHVPKFESEKCKVTRKWSFAGFDYKMETQATLEEIQAYVKKLNEVGAGGDLSENSLPSSANALLRMKKGNIYIFIECYVGNTANMQIYNLNIHMSNYDQWL